MFTVALLAAAMMATPSALARPTGPSELGLPGDAFYPESIAAAPNGALFVSSLVTGEIVRFAPGSSEPEIFVADDVDVGTAGLMVDADRNLLWACAVDLSFQTPSQLRAFDLRTGALKASYTVPDGGVCGDIALARGDVYITDTVGGRILRLQRNGGQTGLAVWSDDPQLQAGAFLKINGIAFDGRGTFYTTNYSTGELFAVGIAPGGSAEPAVPVRLDTPLVVPDGIRWQGGYLYIADNVAGLTRVDPVTGARKVLDASLDQPSSLAFVGDGIWVTEGQVLRLQAGQMPNLPFKVVRLSVR